MKTIKTLWKSTHKINLFIYLIVAVVLTGCSKDDTQEPVVIATPIEEPELSDAKEITSFVFLLTNNPIEVNVVATIDEENKTITAAMPPDTDITGLLPEVKISELSTIDRDTAQDFTEPIEYTVTAEDGSTTVYTVTITNLLTQRQILQAILDANPNNLLGWDLQNTVDLGALVGITTNTEGRIVELIMTFKNLISIPSQIGQLTDLESLFLTGNQLTSLPSEIGKLKNLEILSIIENKFTVILPEIRQLTQLKELYFSDNQLTSVPPEIGQLTNLTLLGLGRNQLTSVPPEIGQLTNLEILGINNNKFTVIPPEIIQLTQLKELYIGDNQLTSVPPEIGQLTNLTNLGLSFNQLTALPPEIGLLTNLEGLYLNDNQLTSVPPELGFLINLTTLRLSENNITAIPISVCFLSVFNNVTTELDDGVGCDITSQKDALISIYSANPGNTLEWGVDKFPEVTFDANGRPTVITMNNKNLSRIPDEIFALNALETLDANNNNLESLPVFLGSIETLAVLTLASNQLNTVPSELGQLSNLALLSLTQNPLNSIPQEVCDLQKSNGGILTLLTDPGEGCN